MESAIITGFTKLVEKLQGWLETTIKLLPNLLVAAVVIFVFWHVSRFALKWIGRALSKTHLTESLVHLLANILRIVILCLGIVTALGILELDRTVYSLLAGVGVVGLALGFAFRDLAANFIAGIMLAIRTPIKIGDTIEIGKTIGTVLDIRLRDTIIRNSDGQDVFVPNKDFTSNTFTNFSSSGERRLRIDVGIGSECDAGLAVKLLAETLGSVEGFKKEKPPEAYVDKFGASTVDLVGYAWFVYPPGSIAKLRSSAYLAVKKAFEAANVSMPSPIQEIDFRPGAKEVFRTESLSES